MKAMRKVYLTFFGIGIIFLLVGIYLLWNSLKIIREGEKTVGIVVDYNSTIEERGGNRIYAPILQYNCNGLERISNSNLYSSVKQPIGEKIDIYCDPTNPDKFIMDSFMNKYFGAIFLFFGAIDIIIAIWFYIYITRKEKLIKYLKESGTPIVSEVTYVGDNHSITINGKHPKVIESIYKIKENIYKFKSENIWDDITDDIKVGDSIEVRVFSDLDGIDYKKYRVNIDNLS